MLLQQWQQSKLQLIFVLIQEFINDSQPAASYRTKTRAQSFQTSTDSRVLFLADYSNHSNRRLTSFFKKVPGQVSK